MDQEGGERTVGVERSFGQSRGSDDQVIGRAIAWIHRRRAVFNHDVGVGQPYVALPVLASLYKLQSNVKTGNELTGRARFGPAPRRVRSRRWLLAQVVHCLRAMISDGVRQMRAGDCMHDLHLVDDAVTPSGWAGRHRHDLNRDARRRCRKNPRRAAAPDGAGSGAGRATAGAFSLSGSNRHTRWRCQPCTRGTGSSALKKSS
jgi:hypothetical protein